MSEPAALVSRGEFEMLKSAVQDNARRIDSIDSVGTRGVATIQVQLTDLAKDVAKLDVRMDQHDAEHTKDFEERARNRRIATRWIITTTIALLAVVEAPLLYLVSLHYHG